MCNRGKDALANETETRPAQSATGTFTALGCQTLTYHIAVKRSEFKISDFLEAVKTTLGKETIIPFFRCSSRNEGTDYHLHVSWREDEEEDAFWMSIDYSGSHMAPSERETEPFAEDFMPWLGRFFTVGELKDVSVSADFGTVARGARVAILRLPFKIQIDPRTPVEVDGISFSLPLKTEGVEKIWLTQLPDTLRVHLVGERSISFASFDPSREVSDLSGAVHVVVEEMTE